MSAPRHRPVLLAEVLRLLAPRDGGIYVDGTFGAGGYSSAILESADCRVLGIDRDPRAIADGATLADRFAGRLTLIEGRFGEMTDLLAAEGVAAADGVALDLGVSSMQLDEAERGFSFRAGGPLDMRMSREGPSAADLVNGLPETELADILFRYGEEKRSRAIARAIIRRRGEAPITRTDELAAVVHSVTGPKRPGRGQSAIDPATRSFQALRIAVNDELGELDRGLVGAEALLKPGGRLAVVSFHSLEDRRVKQFLRQRSGRSPQASRHLPAGGREMAPSFRRCPGDEAAAGEAEVAHNPRARSARLRGAERSEAPPWGAMREAA
ncbi:MAG TPA: 16S rRNA (cytosine(1402)-N(4))-methyltransferase RsmH [Dongiaceae bacterium]|jgi:16S rRNA (cytosine1402-N4)-methyltransferase|nr:16S rRNA (cytosine(1402)-N(4))-methyltransferase RsmH [Dongiaceae bacterium]